MTEEQKAYIAGMVVATLLIGVWFSLWMRDYVKPSIPEYCEMQGILGDNLTLKVEVPRTICDRWLEKQAAMEALNAER